MSDIDIAREVAAELASKVKKQAAGWRWAAGVVVFPDIRCPYCKEAVRSKAIWKHDDNKLIGAYMPKPGEAPKLVKTDHPHARLEWPGQAICFGEARDAHQALFGALNPKAGYRPYVVPFLQSDLMGNHRCDQMLDLKRNTVLVDPDPFEEEEGYTCAGCEGLVDADDVRIFMDDYYCDDCFLERTAFCTACGETYALADIKESPDGDDYCKECWEGRFFECYYCEGTFKLDGHVNDPDGYDCCGNCYEAKCFYCAECNRDRWDEERAEGQGICQDCFDKDLKECVACGEEYHTEDYDQRVEHTHLKCEECNKLYYLTEGEHECAAT